MSHLDNFKDKWLGKVIDYNNDKSYQCVDAVKEYADSGGNKITTYGNAVDYARPGGLGNGWVWIPYKAGMIPPREAIIVWGKPKGYLNKKYYGHIAIVGGGNTKDSINTVAQNDATGNGGGVGQDAVSVRIEDYIGCKGWHVSKIQL